MGFNSEKDGIYSVMNFRKITSRNQPENILKYLNLSQATDTNEDILKCLYFVINNLNDIMKAGHSLSMRLRVW